MQFSAITPATIAAGAKLATAFTGKGGGGGRGGASTAMPASPTTINPAFQQSFTPQFSPAMQQQQDSPGASQTANPTQRANVGQRASPTTGGSGTIMPSREAPLFPASFRDNFAPRESPVFQSANNYNSLIMAGIVVAGAVVVAKIWKNSPTKPSGKKPKISMRAGLNK